MHKKIILAILIALYASRLTYAQQISFLGVPLAGDITYFTKQLALKGTKVNKGISSQLEDGVRAFDVTFFQYPCMGCVQYNTSTRNVYEGTLMFNISSTLSEFTSFMDFFALEIEDKYGKGIFTISYEPDEYKSYPANHYTIFSSKNNKLIGEIYMYMDIKQLDKKTEKGDFLFHVMYRNNEAPSFSSQMQDYF